MHCLQPLAASAPFTLRVCWSSLAATPCAIRVWAATARESASSELASQSWRQIWCAAACAKSERAAKDVASAKVPEMATVRSASRPAST